MRLTPDILLQAYANGLFPMAESAEATKLLWFDPPMRGILPLDERFHLPRRLARTVRRSPYRLSFDEAFERVMRLCAEPAPDRPTTWINEEIVQLYTALHRHGHAHSVELWDGDALVGGLYGVSLGAAFFGETMVSRRTNASKIALVALVAHLRERGFQLLDTQFLTAHLAQFGAVEIPRNDYQRLLAQAIKQEAAF